MTSNNKDMDMDDDIAKNREEWYKWLAPLGKGKGVKVSNDKYEIFNFDFLP